MHKAPHKSALEAYSEGTGYQFNTPELQLGPWTSYSVLNDPKHLCFVLSRYKFCAKMLTGKKHVMEVGSGDGFGLPIVAQEAEWVYAVDWDKRLLDGNQRRLALIKNISYHHVDLNERSPGIVVDAAYAIDVIEHVEPDKEINFMKNIINCLKPDGFFIVGTPNITAAQYASHSSQVQHINSKDFAALRALMQTYFENVFMFGMNDEVLHTGYEPMCHYIWAIGTGVREKAKNV